MRAMVQRLQDTQNEFEAFLPLHHHDVVVVNFGGRRVLGRDDLSQAMRAALASPLADVQTTNEIMDVRLVRPDVAIVSCIKHVFDERGFEETFAARGSLTYVMVRSAGTWQVALAQTTPVAQA